MAEISKIKVNDVTYDIKDQKLRDMMDILLGIKEPESEEESSNKDSN